MSAEGAGPAKRARVDAAAAPDPPRGLWRVYFDGGSRGNPGPAGAGWVLYRPGGEEVAEKGWLWVGDDKTNNESEYIGLRMALVCALSNGVTRLHVFGDSDLILKQVRGEYQCRKEHLQPHHAKCVALTKLFVVCILTHVKRDKNKVADALSNVAMDSRAFGETQSE